MRPREHETALWRAVEEWIDKLNAGEALDREKVRSAHPDLADEILVELETFQGLAREDGPAELGSLGEYRLVREVGRGGMGTVYEAFQGSLERRVALKVLRHGLPQDRKLTARFLREARIAGRLSHPGIVSVYGMGVEDATPFYAMEFVAGETLEEMLRRRDEKGVFGSSEVTIESCVAAARAFAGVAQALEHAHSRGVIHRDLKPSNLILDSSAPDGATRLRILDFGLARFEGQKSLALSGEFLGTPLYMSPEQAMAKRVAVDHRTDLYSLGATLYEVLAGRPLFEGKDYKEILGHVVAREPAPLGRLQPRVPRDLETIVHKCLEKDPRRRYGTAEALAQDLERVARGDPIEARPQSLGERIARRAWRRRRALAAGIALAALLGVTALLYHRSTSDALLRREAEYGPRIEAALRKMQRGVLSERAGVGVLSFIYPGRGGYLHDDLEALTRGSWLDPVREAVRDLEAAAREVPARPEAHYHLARAHRLLGEEALAEREASEALRRDPEFLPARAFLAGRSGSATAAPAPPARAYAGSTIDETLGRGIARLEAGDLEGAIEDFARAEERWPDWLEPGLLKAKAYFLLESPDDAERSFRDLIERTPQRDAAILGVISILNILCEPERGLLWAEQLRDEQLRERTRAGFLWALGRGQEAREAARRALELRPESPEALRTLGYILADSRSRNEKEEAMRYFERLRELRPGEADSHYQLGRLHLFWDDSREKLGKAREYYHAALEKDPASAIARADLGLCLVKLGEEREGLEQLLGAVAMKSGNPHVHGDLTGAYLHGGGPDDALGAAGDAIALGPRFAWPQLARGAVLHARGDLPRAVEAYRRCCEGYPRGVAAGGRSGLAWALAEEGKLAEACAVYREALGFDPAGANGLKRLEAFLLGASNPSRVLFSLWVARSFLELKKTPAELLGTLQGAATKGSTVAVFERLLDGLSKLTAPAELVRLDRDAVEAFQSRTRPPAWTIPLPPGRYRITLSLTWGAFSESASPSGLSRTDRDGGAAKPFEMRIEKSVVTHDGEPASLGAAVDVRDGVLDVHVIRGRPGRPQVVGLHLERME